jgi:hypothetical protein
MGKANLLYNRDWMHPGSKHVYMYRNIGTGSSQDYEYTALRYPVSTECQIDRGNQR